MTAVVAVVLACAPLADAQDDRRVEVVEVDGIVDAAVEGAIVRTIERAEEGDAEAVVLQIDSSGGVGEGRSRRLAERVRDVEVPVVTWVGPPGARAANGAALLALAGDVRAMAPGSVLGPIEVLDLRDDVRPARVPPLAMVEALSAVDADPALLVDPVGAADAEDRGLADVIAPQLPDLLDRIDGRRIEVAGDEVRLDTDPGEVTVRFRKADLWGRMLHAVAQPSITYLLLLLGLIGVVFELFHRDTGPAGASGLVGLALAGYGLWTLGASWVGLAIVVAAVVAFSIDLRFEGLGVFTLGGVVGLIAGSLLLFRDPWLQVNPWVLAFGITGMIAFMLGAMTRVLRDLRAVARGELEVRDAHPHPEAEEVPHPEAAGERKER